VLTGYRIITVIIAARAQKLIGGYEVFCPFFAAGPGLGIRSKKGCLQSGNHDLPASPWFVACGMLTAEVM
jgi:hypothetical protein